MRRLILLPLLCGSARDPAASDRDQVRNVFSRANRRTHDYGTTGAIPEQSEQRLQPRPGSDGGGAHSLAVDAAEGAAACWGNRSAPVTLLTLAAGLSDTYLALLRWNRLAYAARHGLEYCEYTHSIDPGREPTWSKVWAILYLLEDPDGPRSRVQWLDADLLITNPAVSIMNDVLGPLAGRDAVFSADFPAGRGQVTSRINAGSMHLRNSAWTRRFLRHLFATRAGERGTLLALVDGGYDCEQTALMQARAEDPVDFAAHTATAPWNVMNTLGIPNYCDGDFVVHAAGGGNRLSSFFTGRYWHKWGGADKYQQLEEFIFYKEAQKARQRLRGNGFGNEVRCGEFVPHSGDDMVPSVVLVVRYLCLAVAVCGFAAALWSTVRRTAKMLFFRKGLASSRQRPGIDKHARSEFIDRVFARG